MMTALNTWRANAHFTARSHSRPRARGRALVVRTTLVGAVKGASATAQRWPPPTSPTSIRSLDRSVQQHVTTHANMQRREAERQSPQREEVGLDGWVNKSPGFNISHQESTVVSFTRGHDCADAITILFHIATSFTSSSTSLLCLSIKRNRAEPVM